MGKSSEKFGKLFSLYQQSRLDIFMFYPKKGLVISELYLF